MLFIGVEILRVGYLTWSNQEKRKSIEAASRTRVPHNSVFIDLYWF